MGVGYVGGGGFLSVSICMCVWVAVMLTFSVYGANRIERLSQKVWRKSLRFLYLEWVGIYY